MITANELRVGNKVLGASRGGVETVTGSMIAQIEDRKVNVNPIELTPEILEKAEFIIDKDNIYFLDAWTEGHPSARFIIEFKKGVGFMFRSRYEEYNECSKFRNLKYLHQLQNLYYALTGSELQIIL